MKAPLVALVSAVALALAGCAQVIDGEKLQDSISSTIESDTGRTVSSISCPDDEDSETGNTFECTGSLEDGTELQIDVEVTNGENGDVEYTYGPAR